MRVLWIALLIALLPLRGWVGDAMAVSMAAAPLAAAAGQSAMGDDCPHLALGGDMHADAPAGQHGAHAGADMAHAGTHGGAHDASDDAGHTQAHLVCDVCNGPALSSRLALPGPAAATHGPHIARAERFASLAPRHLHKPPIS